MRIREFAEHNYKGIYLNGKTIRIALDPTKPITDLKHPEFYDIKLTDACNGECPYCYQSSNPEDNHFDNVIKKINNLFGVMTENQKPFQVAIGGGEPTLSPNFVEVLKTFYDLGITPNYTTNGMEITNDILEATKQYCGGVAVSCHPHLEQHWSKASNAFFEKDILLNFHNIISDKKSIDTFIEIYTKWKDKVEYFVLLPLGNQGRAADLDIDIEWEYLIKQFDKHNIKNSKIAFGANFYPYLQKNQGTFEVSLYEPEIMSKYLDLKDMSIHKSSFNLNTKEK